MKTLTAIVCFTASGEKSKVEISRPVRALHVRSIKMLASSGTATTS